MFLSPLIGALRRTSTCLDATHRARARRAWTSGTLAVLLAAVPTPGYAQSFFEALFGGPKQPAPAQNFSAPPQRLAPPGHSAGFNAAVGLSSRPYTGNPTAASSQRARRNEDDDEPPARDNKGGHRTVCVRLCDGYYWPVSHGVSRGQFRKDAQTCEASCQGDAKLFHLPSNGEIGDAVDQSGKPYGRLPAAFLYRKKLVAGCACRPEAWSDGEVSRHQVYAFNEAQEKARLAEEAAAEDARIAAAEAAKMATEQRLAEAKLASKTSAKSRQGGVQPAVPVATQTATATAAMTLPGDDPVVGSVTVASATLAPVTSAVPAITAAPRKSRTRQTRDFASVVEFRAANASQSASQSAVPRPARSNQQFARPQPSYASASAGAPGGLFAKKHTWPGD